MFHNKGLNQEVVFPADISLWDNGKCIAKEDLGASSLLNRNFKLKLECMPPPPSLLYDLCQVK